MSSEERPNPHLEVARQVIVLVRKRYDDRKEYVPEIIEFLDQLLLEMITVLISQTSKTLQAPYVKYIQDALIYSAEIVSRTLASHTRYLPVLMKILDSGSKFYAGTKLNFVYYHGYPQSRLNTAKQFENVDGFRAILSLLSNPDFSTPSCDHLIVLLKPLSEIPMDPTVKESLLLEAMKRLMSLTDEQTKKESKILDLIFTIGYGFSAFMKDEAAAQQKSQTFHTFWMQYTLKMLGSGSIVLRLSGWEQVTELIREAERTRPLALTYLVKGAGNPDVNGEYIVREVDRLDGTITYHKLSTRKDMPLLTLFRCAMRSKQKWWFISLQDKEKPCTDRDIDYYQHKSLVHEEREPPPRGWCTATGLNNPGREPAPTLERQGARMPVGVTRDMYLDSQLPHWALSHDLLSLVFAKANRHREVISRSKILVAFLAESGALSLDHLQLIWSTAMESQDVDIVDEVFNVLVSISSSLTDEMYAILIDNALAAVEGAGGGAVAPAGSISSYTKVATLVEKIALNRDVVSSLTGPSSSRLLALLWSVYKNPVFESLKSSKLIQELLSQCLRRPGGEHIVLQSIQECFSQLHQVATASTGEGSAAITTGLEMESSRIVHTLQFLVSKTLTLDVVHALLADGISAKIIAEIGHFVSINRPKFVAGGVEKTWYTTEIASRLRVLRQFYGIHSTVQIDEDVIDQLWAILRYEPAEIDCLAAMFSSGGAKPISILDFSAIGGTSQYFHIFKTVLCSPDIDWSLCGDESYECFNKYFCGLRPVHYTFEERPPLLGLDTLWKIALSATAPAPSKDAVGLLLKSYSEIVLENPDASGQILEQIFAKIVSLTTAVDGVSPRTQASRASNLTRCIDMLQACINKSKPSSIPAHTLCGCMSRLHITISFRRVTTFYNHNTLQNQFRTERGSERSFPIDAHSMHTVLMLKQKVAAHMGLPTASSVLLETSFGKVRDLSTLADLGIVDGSTVGMYSTVSTVINKAYYDDNYSALEEDGLLPSIGQSIVDDPTKFDLLLSLASSENLELARKIWDVMMSIPTKPSIFAAVSSGDRDSPESWPALLSNTSNVTRLYGLQVIDHLLLPAPELRDPTTVAIVTEFRASFLESGGFSEVLKLFTTTPSSSGDINETTLAVALHILHFLLFENNIVEEGEESKSSFAAHPDFLSEIQATSATVIEKLLSVASSAAAAEQSAVVNDALVTLKYLLASADAVSQLITNPASKSLLITVLRSGSKQVREMASEFAVQVGKSEPVVFSWLVNELKSLSDSDVLCTDTFKALRTLMNELHNSHSEVVDWVNLARVVTAKVHAYSQTPSLVAVDSVVLLGHLELLQTLIELNHTSLEHAEVKAEDLAHCLVKFYLFTMPTKSSDSSPICDIGGSKQAVFAVLSSLVTVSPSVFEFILQELTKLSQETASNLEEKWNIQISFDVKRPDVPFAGLKNQGCTCYMNSLLQNLFMNERFREAVLEAPLKECHRLTSWHRTDAELIGLEVLIEMYGNRWHPATVVGWDEERQLHKIRFGDEQVELVKLRTASYGATTGNMRIVSLAGDEEIVERDDAAQRVLEQLQRTFCFMKFSKRRYFDPKPLVEACKTLNLNFNVYHQNDASEFCDQLLDRVEQATKGKHTKVDVWTNVFQSSIFGGQFSYQKIPQECEAYQMDKKQCGHWQSSRQESFLKVELGVRGKENVHDSLTDFVAGELMDGDNKIDCEVCTQKKATVRRTCLETLPNMLIVHLKRFDLDFTTFETVKLNNRMAFETRLNLMKYTKEGMEVEERRQQQAAEAGGDERGNKDQEVQYEEPTPLGADIDELDPVDYEYELQGVLVHAGIAQGGHYYSFVRDGTTADKWYKFDDEDVSHFNPEHIPYQCYGGPANTSTTTTGMQTMLDEDRTSNALMLFFNKTRPRVPVPVPAAEPSAPAATEDGPSSVDALGGAGDTSGGGSSGDTDAIVAAVEVVESAPAAPLPTSRLVTGVEAFYREVQESNMEHLLSRYMLDSDLHSFVRELLDAVVASHKQTAESTTSTIRWFAEMPPNQPAQAVQFSCQFLFNVILHCRERQAMRAWVTSLKNAFEAMPETALWFLRSLIGLNDCDWMHTYLMTCQDALARGVFVQVVTQALSALVSKDPTTADDLQEIAGVPPQEVKHVHDDAPGNAPLSVDLLNAVLVLLINDIFDEITNVPLSPRNADDLFVLIREMATFPSIRKVLLQNYTICRLMYFVNPELSPKQIKALFEANQKSIQARGNKADFYLTALHTTILEAVAGLLGVPQTRKVNLLQDNRVGYDYELVPEAREAFSVIFKENAIKGGMDAHSIVEYREKTGLRVTIQSAKLILTPERTTADGRLSLEGFLGYYAEQASYYPKDVWRDLHAFGFRNDLTRAAPDSQAQTGASGGIGGGGDSIVSLEQEGCPKECLVQLRNLNVYVTPGGPEVSEAGRAILKKICAGQEQADLLIKQTIFRLFRVASEVTWGQEQNLLAEILRIILSIDDGFKSQRLVFILTQEQYGLATMVVKERNAPSICKANDYDKDSLFRRYLQYAETLLSVEGVRAIISELTRLEGYESIRILKSNFRVPGSIFNEGQLFKIQNSAIVVEGAGVAEVNGIYRYTSMLEKWNCGLYTKEGVWENRVVRFTLYKCSVTNGGFQWFVSITPDGTDPGSNKDIDFYYAMVHASVWMPPERSWSVFEKAPHARGPPPTMRVVSTDGQSVPSPSSSPARSVGAVSPLAPARPGTFPTTGDDVIMGEDGDDYDDDARRGSDSDVDDTLSSTPGNDSFQQLDDSFNQDGVE